MPRFARWLACLWLTLLPLLGWGEVALPTLATPVTDLTGTLSAADKAALDSRLRALEKDKGSQIAILMLPTTQPESIEQFGIRLAEKWKIGRKGVDDGIIVIVAKNDRKMRIEVGYGLEGAVPDALAKRIVSEAMAPRFIQGDFAGGLQASLDYLEKAVRGEPLPAPRAATAPNGQGGGGEGLMALIVVILMAGVARSMFGLVGSLGAAGFAGWLAWGLFASLGIAGIAALAAFALSFIHLGGGGWHSGGGGGGGLPGGFGGGGGGSWGGGGGGFGGGGASGSW